MANVDTGLGWSADGEWLRSVSTKFAELTDISSSMFPSGPLPTAAYDGGGVSEIVAKGRLVATKIVSGVTQELYAFCETSGVDAYMGAISGYGGVCGFSSFNGAIIRFATTYGNHAGSLKMTRTTANADIFFQYASTGWMGGWQFIDDVSAYTRDEIATSFTISSTSFYKLNAGPAVVCNINWKDTTNRAVWTPMLISTDESAAKISLDGSTEYYGAATSIQRYNGMPFFCTYVRSISGAPTPESYNMVDVSAVVQSIAQIFRGIAGPSYANILVNETVDPYDPFGNTEEGGGEPDPNPQDDDIEEEDLPTLSFSSAGFARIYRPNLQQINDLADYMWTDQTFLQTVINHLKQLLENPMDSVISLSLVPCVPPVGADVPVKVMYVNTRVSMPPVTNQFVQVDCGSFTLKEMYGSALDYNPYTKVQLYLPYVGTVKLDTDEVMGKTLQVKYNIDVVTGVCCAYVIAGGDVLYQFSGHCSINQPISSADFSSYINAAIAAAKVGIAAATGGAAAAAGAAAGGAPAPTPAVGGGSSAPELPPSTALVPAVSSGPYQITPQYPGGSGIRIPNINFAELAKPGNINTVASAMGGKVDVMHSGGFGGNSGYLAAVRRPYLIVTRPRIANPQQYGQFNGRPSMMYLNLGSCTGYTQVQSVYLTGFDATNPELAEISELLKGGVVL